MSRSRKTISIVDLKSAANEYLANPEITSDVKLGIVVMVETALHKANAYNGFMFLSIDPEGPEIGTPAWFLRKYL